MKRDEYYIIDVKDQELINKFFRFVRSLSEIIPPPDKKGKLSNIVDMAENTIEFINKIVDEAAVKMKNLPSYMNKIFEINRDAQKAFEEKRFSDYIMLKYKGIEIFYKSLYQELFNKEQKDNDLIDILKEIENSLEINSGILKELLDWRTIRNKIVHEHFKADKKLAEESKEFFKKLYKLFKTYTNELKFKK